MRSIPTAPSVPCARTAVASTDVAKTGIAAFSSRAREREAAESEGARTRSAPATTSHPAASGRCAKRVRAGPIRCERSVRRCRPSRGAWPMETARAGFDAAEPSPASASDCATSAGRTHPGYRTVRFEPAQATRTAPERLAAFRCRAEMTRRVDSGPWTWAAAPAGPTPPWMPPVHRTCFRATSPNATWACATHCFVGLPIAATLSTPKAAGSAAGASPATSCWRAVCAAARTTCAGGRWVRGAAATSGRKEKASAWTAETIEIATTGFAPSADASPKPFARLLPAEPVATWSDFEHFHRAPRPDSWGLDPSKTLLKPGGLGPLPHDAVDPGSVGRPPGPRPAPESGLRAVPPWVATAPRPEMPQRFGAFGAFVSQVFMDADPVGSLTSPW